jgi:hypothetical protein
MLLFKGKSLTAMNYPSSHQGDVYSDFTCNFFDSNNYTYSLLNIPFMSDVEYEFVPMTDKSFKISILFYYFKVRKLRFKDTSLPF